MRMTFVRPILSIALAVIACVSRAGPELERLQPEPQQSVAARLTAELITRYNYKALPLDKTMSAAIYDHYLKALDPQRVFFLQSDIDMMNAERLKLADAIMQQDLRIPFAMFNLYRERASERLAAAQERSGEQFDFSVHESFKPQREEAPWARSTEELDQIWQQRIKNERLRLRLVGESETTIADTLRKSYAAAMTDIERETSSDAFELFMNAYTMAVDPHSNYMGPRSAEDFDVQMSLSLVGIGATMAEKDGFNTVEELNAKGPAKLSGKLHVGDRLVGVAQAVGQPFVDVRGKRLDETVSLVRGAVGSTVVLDILPVGVPRDGKHVTVELRRQKVSLDEEGARKSLVTVEGSTGPRRIGVITLPSFYRDVGAQMGGDKNFKSASADMIKLIGELKAEKADGILVDLRNNGGGSVLEAVAVTGLFTGKGPVLQERDAKGKVVVNEETRHQAVWTGPVGVLINRNSASASEIFAAAIQDYGRGVVIGERSFGKGTVQTTVDLDHLVEHKTPLFGEVKMTIAQFFRINGGTTQLHGVLPDVDLAIPTDGRPWGESGFDNPLPYSSVKPAEYTPSDAVRRLFPTLQARSEARRASDGAYTRFKQSLAQEAQLRKSNVLSLNEDERRRQRAQADSHAAVIAAARVEPEDHADLDDPARALPAAKPAHDAPDVLLAEAVKIVGDETELVLKARLDARAIEARTPTTAAPAAGAHEL